MPYYLKWLYRPKREGETEQDKIFRKLSFKLPVVVRYNVFFAFFIGLFAAFYTKKSTSFFYFYRYTPLAIAGLCYEQIYRLYCFRQGLAPPNFAKAGTFIDLLKNQQKLQ